MPNGMGRVNPRRPLSPSVTDTQRYAVPQRTCESARVIMRKPSPVARSEIHPNAQATSVVASSAAGAGAAWPRPGLSDIPAEGDAAGPSHEAGPGEGSPPHPPRRVRLPAKEPAIKIRPVRVV